MPFKIIRDDITRVKADVIVNTANPMPVYGRGTDEAIYSAAGREELLEVRKKIGEMSPGEAAVSEAFALPAKYIIHTCGPEWIDGEHQEKDILRSCYRKSLYLARQLGCQSIAFPLISAGVYGYPQREAIKMAVETMKGHQDDFDEIIPLSALKSRNITELVETIKKYLPEDVQYYPSDMISDYPESFMFSEIVREKIMMATDEEVPHSIAVQTEEITRKPNVVYVRVAIVVEKSSQKAIIIGRNGSMIKKISTAAREELEERLNSKVFLETFVRVEPDWRNRPSQLQEFGYWDSVKDE